VHFRLKLLILQIIGLFLIFAAALFFPAGTIAWPAGWMFLGLFFGFIVAVYVWLFRHNPELLQERLRIGGTSDQQGWDKVLYPLLEVFLFVWMILMSLDVVRFRWSQMPFWLQVVGALVLLCSFYLFFLTFRENSYLSPVVRVQQDRGQSVISTGPYRYVRHPFYSGIVIFVFGTALFLGSWYGLFFGLIPAIVIARRAVLEEHMLRNALPGYAAYMAQVKYRLVPHVW